MDDIQHTDVLVVGGGAAGVAAELRPLVMDQK